MKILLFSVLEEKNTDLNYEEKIICFNLSFFCSNLMKTRGSNKMGITENNKFHFSRFKVSKRNRDS